MINVQNLTYSYPNQRDETIKNLNFTIAKGEIYGFLGPSGAGKSTTQKLLIRLLSGFSGNIQVLGRLLKNWDNSYYNHIGVGFELPNHYAKLTGLENLQLFASFYEKQPTNLMAL
ncbi:MAG TPA: ATP-binding protein, partial [Marinilabiliales bacterium]|nr:ATP-binding protein [Marinilabiliales bacterium]